jgi:ankyrin repeat protein
LNIQPENKVCSGNRLLVRDKKFRVKVYREYSILVNWLQSYIWNNKLAAIIFMKSLPTEVRQALKSSNLSILINSDLSRGREYGAKGKTLLHYAAKHSASSDVLRYLTKRLKISARSTCRHKRVTALHYACKRGHLAVVKYLIQETKVNINTLKKGKMSPLLLAAKHSRTEVVHYLIEKGANLHHTDKNGWNIIHWAARTANDSLLWTFYNIGMHMNVRTRKGELPIHIAAQSGSISTVHFFMMVGQSLYMFDCKGKSILDHCKDWGMVEWILSNTFWALLKDKVIYSLLCMNAPMYLLLQFFHENLKLVHAVMFDRVDIAEFLMKKCRTSFKKIFACTLGKNLQSWVEREFLWYRRRGLIYVKSCLKRDIVGSRSPLSRLPSCIIREITHYL